MQALTRHGALVNDASTLRVEYAISLPVVDDARAGSFNQEMISLGDYYMRQYLPMRCQEFAEKYEGTDTPLSVSITFETAYNENGIVSFLICEAVSQGDQYEDWYAARTFDAATGSALVIDDFFPAAKPALPLLAGEVARQVGVSRAEGNPWSFYDDVDANVAAMYISEQGFFIRGDGAAVLVLDPRGLGSCESGLCAFPLDSEYLSVDVGDLVRKNK